MNILSVGRAQPPHYYDQDQLVAALEQEWAKQHHNVRRVEQFFRAVMVDGRHLALPIEAYPKTQGWGEANDAFIRVGTDVAEAAIHEALDLAGLSPQDVDVIYFASVTGIAAPSIDARLVNRMGFRSDIKRYPLFGLGCVAGAAGVARLNDYLHGWREGVALLVCVELCSLTMQRDDFSIANLIGSGLFGDGGAAVVAVGADHPKAQQNKGPQVLCSKSRFYPNTERVMGWDISEKGFKIVLSDTVPNVVRDFMGDDVDSFLSEQGLSQQDIGSWVCHPGGPKVLEAFEQALQVERNDLQLTWDSLRKVGNMSSASVLFVLRDTMELRRPEPGTLGLLLAMGPGFCSELVLLRW